MQPVRCRPMLSILSTFTITSRTPPSLKRTKRKDTPIIRPVSNSRSTVTGDSSLPIPPRKCRRTSLPRTSRMASGATSLCPATGRWKVMAMHSSAMCLLRSRPILLLCPVSITPLALIGRPLPSPHHGRASRYSFVWRRHKVPLSYG